VTGRRINSSRKEKGALSRQNPLGECHCSTRMMEEPIDKIPDVESPECLLNLDFGWSFQNPACDVQSQVSRTLVKGPREGHATHGIADQTPVALSTRPCPE